MHVFLYFIAVMWVRDKLGLNSIDIFHCILILLSKLLIQCYSYKILNYAIDYTNLKSIALVFIPFLTQPNTDSLDSRFSNESVCIVNILGVSLKCILPLQYIFDSHEVLPDSLVSKYW